MVIMNSFKIRRRIVNNTSYRSRASRSDIFHRIVRFKVLGVSEMDGADDSGGISSIQSSLC